MQIVLFVPTNQTIAIILALVFHITRIIVAGCAILAFIGLNPVVIRAAPRFARLDNTAPSKHVRESWTLSAPTAQTDPKIQQLSIILHLDIQAQEITAHTFATMTPLPRGRTILNVSHATRHIVRKEVSEAYAQSMLMHHAFHAICPGAPLANTWAHARHMQMVCAYRVPMRPSTQHI